MYDQERLLQWLGERMRSAANAAALRDGLAAELERFCGGEPLRDDQAFVVLLEQTAAVAPVVPTRTTGDFLASDTPESAREYVFPPVPLIPTQP
jgi:hypothetical protein